MPNDTTVELYYLGLVTGLRRGELPRLKRTDVDLQSGIIQIRRQIYRVDGVVAEPSRRTA